MTSGGKNFNPFSENQLTELLQFKQRQMKSNRDKMAA